MLFPKYFCLKICFFTDIGFLKNIFVQQCLFFIFIFSFILVQYDCLKVLEAIYYRTVKQTVKHIKQKQETKKNTKTNYI